MGKGSNHPARSPRVLCCIYEGAPASLPISNIGCGAIPNSRPMQPLHRPIGVFFACFGFDFATRC